MEPASFPIWQMGYGLGLFALAILVHTGQRIMRIWTQPQHRRRVRQRLLDYRMEQNRRAAMARLQPPSPKWMREN